MHVRALERLADLTGQLLDRADLAKSLERVTEMALELLPADHASVRLDEAGELRVKARSGVGAGGVPPRFRRGEGVLGWVAETGCTVRLGDARHDPRYLDVPDNPVPCGSMLGVPIHCEGDTAGVLTLCAAQTDAFDPDDEAVSMLLANAAAGCIRAARLQELAITDPTTGSYNRRSLLPRLDEEIERATRRDEPLSVLLLDLDHFKEVNDRYGHAVGDEVLRAFADEVRDCVRSIDVLVRRGGEEFVLVMPGTAVELAEMVAERIRARLDEHPLRVRGGASIRQTVSIGVATWDCEESAEALEERADQAMYDAKRAGRDRVSLAPRASSVRASPGAGPHPALARRTIPRCG